MNTEVGLPGLAGSLRDFGVAVAWFSGAGAVYTLLLIVSTENGAAPLSESRMDLLRSRRSSSKRTLN
jgi:hypothetical protein